MRIWPAAVLAATALLLGACDSKEKQSASNSILRPTPCGTYSGSGCALPSERVDLAKPSFTHSTTITNPLFPISRLRSVVLLGHVEGKPFRTETTLLPGTSTVTWDGEQ